MIKSYNTDWYRTIAMDIRKSVADVKNMQYDMAVSLGAKNYVKICDKQKKLIRYVAALVILEYLKREDEHFMDNKIKIFGKRFVGEMRFKKSKNRN